MVTRDKKGLMEQSIYNPSMLSIFLSLIFSGRQLVDSTFDTTDLQNELPTDPDISHNWSMIHSHMTSGITNPAYLAANERPQVRWALLLTSPYPDFISYCQKYD